MLSKQRKTELEVKYKHMETEALLQIVSAAAREYEEEAVDTAKAELRKRNVAEDKIAGPVVAAKAQTLRSLSEVEFFNTSRLKIAVFSICTLGIYEVFWFYKNWEALKEQTGVNISPFWRGWFSIFFCYPLFKNVKSSVEAKGIHFSPSPAWLTAQFCSSILLSNILARIDNRFIAAIGWLSFILVILPLITAQNYINLSNTKVNPSYAVNNRFNWKSVLLIVIGGLIFIGVFFDLARGNY